MLLSMYSGESDGEREAAALQGSAKVIARSSPYALYSAEMSSFDSKAIDQKDAEGTASITGSGEDV